MALTLVVLMGFAALAIDVSMARVSKQQLANAAEAGSHAGAAQLDGTVEGMSAARAMAVSVAGENRAQGAVVTIDENTSNDPAGDVVLGFWNGTAITASSDPALVTTVQVRTEKTDLLTTFARVAFDADSMSASDFAIAQAGGPGESNCPMPISLADCEVEAVADTCNLDIVLTADRIDNGAWARKGSTQANASYIRDALDSSICAGASQTGENVTLNNGAVTSGLKELADAVSSSPLMWDSATMGPQPAQLPGSSVTAYGHVFYGQVMVFEDAGNCTNLKYNGTKPILGYATAVVYDIISSGSGKTIKMRIGCDEEPGAAGGGAYFGTTVTPKFVR